MKRPPQHDALATTRLVAESVEQIRANCGRIAVTVLGGTIRPKKKAAAIKLAGEILDAIQRWEEAT